MLARAVAEYGRDGPEGTGAQQEGSGLDSCVAAEGPGAAYAAADEHGVVTNYTDDAAAADCRLDLVDLGAIGIRSWLFDPIPNYSYTVPATSTARTASPKPTVGSASACRSWGEREDGAADPTVIVAGLGDSSGLPQLRAFIAAGPASSPVPCPRRRPAPRGCCS
jgi:hypothetical protein